MSAASRPGPAIGSDRTVLVVIVNYRIPRLVVDSLRALAAEVQARPTTRVVVVDNRSEDDSVAVIGAAIEVEGWAGWATLVASPVNGGFSYGNNLAVRPALQGAAPPDYVWLLNPDTAVRPGALRALADFLDARPQVGIAGSQLELIEGEPWRYAFRFPSIWSELESGLRLGLVSALLRQHTVRWPMGDAPQRVEWVPGASMMVRREVFETVGLMDEGYFLYFEETDFCLQAARAGWECWYVPQSRVMHISGQSTGLTGRQAVRRRLPGYWFDSRRRFFVKNHGRLAAGAIDLVWLLAFVLWRLRRCLQRKPDADPPHQWIDQLRHSALLNGGLPGNAMLDAAPAVRFGERGA